MSENTGKVLSKEAEGFLQRLEAVPGVTEEVVSFVRKDLEAGIPLEQVRNYIDKTKEIRSIKLYSKCLRNGYGMDVINILISKDADISRNELAVDFYGRGISVETIQKAMNETNSAREMEKLLQEVLSQKEELTESSEEVPPYARQLLAQIQTIVGQIQLQENMYGELQKAVTILQDSKKEDAEKERLLQDIKSRDMLISSQQDDLNMGHKKLAQLRTEIEKQAKEVEALRETITGLEAKLQEKEEMMKDVRRRTTGGSSIPVYYSVPVVDRGKVVSHVDVEHTRRKGNAPRGLFEKLFGAIMPGQDIVKKVIAAGLDEQQLAQIHIAMEKGLTETQLNRIINPELSPQKMSEIIELAVLVNQNQ